MVANDFETKVTSILWSDWNIQDARVVPRTEDVVQYNGAKRLRATYIYADMADSTLLVKRHPPETAARIIRAYLRIAVDCIRAKGGHIRSFDGDRAMGIFIGERRRNDAVEAGLNISWVVDQVLNPDLKTLLWKSATGWQVRHRSGIDDGDTFIVRGGARNNNDLVSIGDAPNIAAKLSGIRGESGSMTVTSRVYDYLLERNQTACGGESMWQPRSERFVGPHRVDTYSCGWMREP